MTNRGYTPSGPTANEMPPPPPAMTESSLLTEECDCGKIHPVATAVEVAGGSTEWAVEWQPVTDLETGDTTPAGVETMPDRDDFGRESAEHLLAKYPHWPGRIVRRTIVVGPWQPVDGQAA